MRNFFKGKQAQYNYDKNFPEYLSELPQGATEEIRKLFLQISSLTEISRQYQTQRRVLEEKGSNFEIIEILNKELDVVYKIDQSYQKIKSHFIAIQHENTTLSKQTLEHIQQKIAIIDKEVKTIPDHQRYLTLLKESEKKKNRKAYIATEFCKNNEHVFKYSEHDELYVCTKCGYKLSYQ